MARRNCRRSPDLQRARPDLKVQGLCDARVRRVEIGSLNSGTEKVDGVVCNNFQLDNLSAAGYKRTAVHILMAGARSSGLKVF